MLKSGLFLNRLVNLNNLSHVNKFKMAGTKRTSSGAVKSADAKESASKKPENKMNKTETDWKNIDFQSDAKAKNGSAWNLKISSWNVDGLRACAKKGGAEFIKYESPDILCLQETKVNLIKPYFLLSVLKKSTFLFKSYKKIIFSRLTSRSCQLSSN